MPPSAAVSSLLACSDSTIAATAAASDDNNDEEVTSDLQEMIAMRLRLIGDELDKDIAKLYYRPLYQLPDKAAGQTPGSARMGGTLWRVLWEVAGSVARASRRLLEAPAVMCGVPAISGRLSGLYWAARTATRWIILPCLCYMISAVSRRVQISCHSSPESL